MKRIEKAYFIGLGAIGSAYASIIQDKEPESLRIIADGDRIKKYSEDGMVINGRPCRFNYVEPGSGKEDADLIIISVKFHQLEQAIEDIRSFVGPDTIIMSLLNGISSEEIISREYGTDKVLYSFCIGIDALRVGTKVEFSKYGKVVFGEKNNFAYSPKVAAVQDFFDRTGVPYEIPADIIREQWFKFMINVGANQSSAILRATYGDILSTAEAVELTRSAAFEVVEIARKIGIDLSEKDIDKFFRLAGNLSPKNKTSMLQDVEAGRKTEVEMFSGEVVELGKKYGVETPVNRTIFSIIRAMEKLYMK